MIGTTISDTVRPIRTLLLIMTVAGLVAACGEGTSDSFTVTISQTGDDIQVEIDPIDTDVDGGSDIDVDGDGDGDGNGDVMLGTATLDQVIAQPLNGEPINDGLDQVEADLLTTFGSSDSEPFTVNDDDTVESLLSVASDR